MKIYADYFTMIITICSDIIKVSTEQVTQETPVCFSILDNMIVQKYYYYHIK